MTIYYFIVVNIFRWTHYSCCWPILGTSFWITLKVFSAQYRKKGQHWTTSVQFLALELFLWNHQQFNYLFINWLNSFMFSYFIHIESNLLIKWLKLVILRVKYVLIYLWLRYWINHIIMYIKFNKFIGTV